MKKLFLVLMLVFLMIFSLSCAKEEEEDSESDSKRKTEMYENIIRSAGVEEVAIEVNYVDMYNESYGTAKIIAKVPDYTQLFESAVEEEDMTKALARAIKKGEYPTVDYPTNVPVTVVDGEQILDSDAEIKRLIEKELIKAINIVMANEAEVAE